MNFIKDKLNVKIFETRDKMGIAAADDVAAAIKELLAEPMRIVMVEV